MRRHFPILAILAVYFVLGALFATRIPHWQTPDEPAHYNYIWQLAAGTWPKIEPSDWKRDFQGIGPQTRFEEVPAIFYQDHQPPLFYALGLPAFVLSGASLTALRLFCVLLGALGVTACYACVLTIFPGKPALAALAATLYALLPQHLHMLAGYNNDSLSEALLGLTLWQSLRILRADAPTTARERILLGLTVGLALFAKAQAYLALPTALLATLASGWRLADAWRAGIKSVLIVAGVAVLVAAPLWIRNISVYGGADFLGLQSHDAAVIGQPTTAEWLVQFGAGELVSRFVRSTFQSFWGQFGWMSIPNDRLYAIALLLTAVSCVLFIAWLRGPGRMLGDAQKRQLTLLAMLTLMTLLAYAWYNQKFVQHQGRYLYPALIPITAAFALGWDWLSLRLPNARSWAWLGMLVFFAALDLWLLLRVILPTMQPQT